MIISRRHVLRTTGVSVALPALEAMGHDGPPKSPNRMLIICTTLGLHSPSFWPSVDKRPHETSEYLDLLKQHRSDFTVLSGLCHANQSGRRPHDSEVSWLTAAENPGFSGFRNSISVDQLAASHVGNQTRFPSLTLATNNSASQSYTANGVMVSALTKPSKLFESLFVQGTDEQKQEQRRRLAEGKSVLDHLRNEVKRVKAKSSGQDGRLLDEYFASIRQSEKKLQDSNLWAKRDKPRVEIDRPKDVIDNSDLSGRVTRLLELVPAILRTDSSRVITLMIQDHNAVPKIAGVSGNHHNLSHHGQDAAKIEQLRIIESELIRCFGNLLSQLKATKDAHQPLLDSTEVLFGSNLGNANMHSTRNLPIVLAGGKHSHGHLQEFEDGTPLSNLFLRMLNNFGVSSQSFGQSSRPLSL